MIGVFASRVLWRYARTVCKGMDQFKTSSVAIILWELLFFFFVLGLLFKSSLTISLLLTGLVVVNAVGTLVAFGGCRIPLLATPDFTQLCSQFRSISVPLIPKSILKK